MHQWGFLSPFAKYLRQPHVEGRQGRRMCQTHFQPLSITYRASILTTASGWLRLNRLNGNLKAGLPGLIQIHHPQLAGSSGSNNCSKTRLRHVDGIEDFQGQLRQALGKGVFARENLSAVIPRSLERRRLKGGNASWRLTCVTKATIKVQADVRQGRSGAMYSIMYHVDAVTHAVRPSGEPTRSPASFKPRK